MWGSGKEGEPEQQEAPAWPAQDQHLLWGSSRPSPSASCPACGHQVSLLGGPALLLFAGPVACQFNCSRQSPLPHPMSTYLVSP